MTTKTIAAPGSHYGPCVECQHPDCQGLRALADWICPVCRRPIGYERRFVLLGNLGAVHDVCMERQNNDQKIL